MLILDSDVLYNYVFEQKNKVNELTEKEIMLTIMAAQHLQNCHNFTSGISVAATTASTILALVASAPVILAGALTVGLAGTVKTITGVYKSRKLNKLCIELAEMAAKRYENYLVAYFEIAEIVTSIEREDIIEFFEQANAVKNK